MDRETFRALDSGIRKISETMDKGNTQRVIALAPILRDLAVSRAVLTTIRNQNEQQYW